MDYFKEAIVLTAFQEALNGADAAESERVIEIAERLLDKGRRANAANALRSVRVGLTSEYDKITDDVIRAVRRADEVAEKIRAAIREIDRTLEEVES